MQNVTKEITVKTHKGEGDEVTFSATFNRPATMDECVDALRGEAKLVEFVGDVLEQKAFAAGKARMYNYALKGAENTAEARAKALASAIEAVSDYTYSARGESVKSKAEALDAARALAAQGGSLEDIKRALGLV